MENQKYNPCINGWLYHPPIFMFINPTLHWFQHNNGNPILFPIANKSTHTGFFPPNMDRAIIRVWISYHITTPFRHHANHSLTVSPSPGRWSWFVKLAPVVGEMDWIYRYRLRPQIGKDNHGKPFHQGSFFANSEQHIRTKTWIHLICLRIIANMFVVSNLVAIFLWTL